MPHREKYNCSQNLLYEEDLIEQQKETNNILTDIESELEKEQIYFVNEKNVFEAHQEFLKEYFIRKVSPALMTIIISDNSD